MKLLRWTLAGASFYVIYKYSIGKKAQGKDVFVTPENDQQAPAADASATAEKPKRPRKTPAKRTAK